MDEEVKLEIIKRLLGWFPKIRDTFLPFKPEIKELGINYREKSATLSYSINMGNSDFRRSHQKIVIPKSENLKITSILGEDLNDYKKVVKIDESNSSYIIKPNDLPSFDNFRIQMKGSINEDNLKQLIYIQPAINQNSTQSFDKYWLYATIRNVDYFANIYNALEIEDIKCNVNISIERYFSTQLPDNLRKIVNAYNAYLSAGSSTDRHKAFRAWNNFRIATRDIDDKGIVDYFKNLMQDLTLQKYVSVDNPYCCGEIGDPKSKYLIPSSFSVEAITQLNLTKPAAGGYLSFHKKTFVEKVKEALDGKFEENKINR